MDTNEYIQDPCRMLSIPYWKHQSITPPAGIVLVHESDYHPEDHPPHDVRRFFRLIHCLNQRIQPDPRVTTMEPIIDQHELVRMIEQSYRQEGIRVTNDEVMSWTKRDVYDSSLWVKVVQEGRMVASGIAEYDEQVGEGILEWIQVHPDAQGQGLGQAIVATLLHRLQGKARFVTVSGRVDNPARPERLYRKMGFEGTDVWFMLTIQKDSVK